MVTLYVNFLFSVFHKGNELLSKIATNWYTKPSLEISYSCLFRLHDVKIQANFRTKFFIKSERIHRNFLLDQSLVNLSIFYVQITNKCIIKS